MGGFMSVLRLFLVLSAACLPVAADGGFLGRQLPLTNNKANRLFEQQQYEEALKSYLDLYGQNTDNGALAYNIGNTYAVLGDMKKAEEFFRKAVSSNHTVARNRANFNLGNLELAADRAQQAIARYIDYLKANPDDVDGKRNLEIALRNLEQQKQQQQENQDQENQDQENQDQENQDQRQSQGKDQQQDQENRDQQQEQSEDQENRDQQQAENQQQDEQNNQDQQDSQEQDQDQKEEQQKESQTKPSENSLNEAMKQQILDALKEQEMQQQKEYRKRQIGKTRRRAKDW